MKKNIMMTGTIILLAAVLGACGANQGRREQQKPAEIVIEPELIEASYSMLLYTQTSDAGSTIQVEYPSFQGSNAEALNTLVSQKVQDLIQANTAFSSGEAGITMDYRSEVTLLNSKAVSMIFWGSGSIEGGAYAAGELSVLNIDLASMEEIHFEDLYIANDAFQTTFFEHAFYPTDPVTSCERERFAEMLKLQTPEYQSVDPFSIPGNVTCFLKPDGIVLSMPAMHVTGYDHFEAQLTYEDIQQFYLPGNKYWDDESGKNDTSKVAFMMEGDIGCLGLGELVCTLPGQKSEDYQIYFFRSKKDAKAGQTEAYDWEAADDRLPDVRENNVSIGKFMEIYYLDLVDLTKNATPELLVVAQYEVEGRICYDTRVYEAAGKNFVVHDQLTQEMNQKYCEADDYPIGEIIDLPHD